MPDPTLADIMAKLQLIEQRLNAHLGYNSSASQPGTPHPDLSAVSRGAYVITNGSADRAMDASTALVGEVANVLYTVISDLQVIKVLG